jgi:hypothetical protein
MNQKDITDTVTALETHVHDLESQVEMLTNKLINLEDQGAMLSVRVTNTEGKIETNKQTVNENYRLLADELQRQKQKINALQERMENINSCQCGHEQPQQQQQQQFQGGRGGRKGRYNSPTVHEPVPQQAMFSSVSPPTFVPRYQASSFSAGFPSGASSFSSGASSLPPPSLPAGSSAVTPPSQLSGLASGTKSVHLSEPPPPPQTQYLTLSPLNVVRVRLNIAREKKWENVVELVHAYDEALNSGISKADLKFVEDEFNS